MSESVLFNKDKRLIHLFGDVDNETVGKINYNLLSLLEEDEEKESKEKDFIRKPIKIYINSYGGNVYDMWALIDIIENSKTPIYTYCTGYAMSAAFQIFISGHKRFISKHATLLYHQISCWIDGKYQDVAEKTKQVTYLQNMVEKYVVSKTKITMNELKRIRETKFDYYIYTEDAIKLGCADEIIKD